MVLKDFFCFKEKRRVSGTKRGTPERERVGKVLANETNKLRTFLEKNPSHIQIVKYGK